MLVVAAMLALLAGPAAASDVLATLTDMDQFQKTQKDIQGINSIAELDALNDTLSTCSAASLGQRQQHFECERAVKRYWTRYNRGRNLDNFVAAIGSLFEGFDNAGANPTDAMATAYRRGSMNIIGLLRDINTRYTQLDKH
jgi:hypothetical protein